MDNQHIPDFSALESIRKNIQETTRVAMQAVIRIKEIVRPVVEYWDTYKERIAKTVQEMARIMRPLLAIQKMSDVQFVCWKTMDAAFVDAIIDSKNINKTLRERMEKEKYRSVFQTVDATKTHPLMKKHLRIYSQAVSAFNRCDCDLAVIGFTSVLDGILAKVSNNPTHKLAPRIQVIKDKLERDDVLENEEYAMLTLALTLEKTLDSFSTPAPFTQPEPKPLNRHWIAHGRSIRRKTKLDCVKLINLIYGLLLIYDLDAKLPVEHQT